MRRRTAGGRVFAEPDPILAVADRLEPVVRARFLAALRAAQRTARATELVAALGRPSLVDQVAGLEALVVRGLEAALLEALVEPLTRAAVEALAAAPVPAGTEVALRGRFAVLNARAAAWATAHSAQLVRQITEDQRAWLRSVVHAGYVGEQHPRITARVIQQRIGLTTAMQGWVTRAAATLAGLPTAARERAVAAYADRLRRWRAETIARTETLHASNFGQHLVWNELVAQTGVAAAAVQRVWIAKPEQRRTCAVCRQLDGRRVGLNAPFVHPTTRLAVLVPPLHPRCRCAVALHLPDPTAAAG